MKLYLAVAVLMLAFVAYTEAQEETVEQKFTKFTQHMTEMGQNVADRARTTFEEFQNSEFAKKSQDWFQTQLENMKAKLGELGQ